MNRKLFTFILLLVTLVFIFWFFRVYRPRQDTSSFLGNKKPGGKTEKVLWGYPEGKNVKIFDYEGFVSGYDTLRLNPLWVAYELKKEYIKGRKFLEGRKFSPDPSLDHKHTAVDSDFRNSGFDRGHLARQSDMKGRSALCETQSLYFTNICPQRPSFNRETWNNLEMAADRLTSHFGRSWIITGPYFDDDSEFINGRVEIPDGFYKIIIIDTGNGLHPAAFVLNMYEDGKNIEKFMVTIDSVESLTGLDFFHELDNSNERILESSLFRLPYQWKR